MASDTLIDGSQTNGAAAEGQNIAIKLSEVKPERKARKYRHVAAIHKKSQTSCLSHDSETVPSFLGFRNLLVLVVIVMNLRLVLENHMKYGFLICFTCLSHRRQDLLLGGLLFALVPCHLFVAFLVELTAAEHAKDVVGARKKNDEEPASENKLSMHGKQKRQINRPSANQNIEGERAKNPKTMDQLDIREYDPTWQIIGLAHAVNATLCLLVTSLTVFFFIHNPLIGTISEIHAITVWLKSCSYAFTNRDLRHAMLHPRFANLLPELYLQNSYPKNITVGNLCYFWWAPTLVYQPIYPRSVTIRWGFVAKRLSEAAALGIFVWLTSAQYAVPLLRNSLGKVASLEIGAIVERVLKLSTISLIIWLASFFAIFQSLCNALAEVMRFGDRDFYEDWWNSPSVGVYWRTWNKPVHQFMKRHVYSPLVERGWSSDLAAAAAFVMSAVLHEMMVGIPTHNILGVAFLGMLLQIPLVLMTRPLEKVQGTNGKIVGNCIFWVSFCLVGQPLAALLYFFAWQAKYGNMKPLP